MDRLIKLDPSNIVLIRVEEGQKCIGKITLNNVMYTMPVAFRIQPLIKTRYTIKPQSGIISPLASLVIEITYHPPQQQGSNNLPHSFPFSDDSFLLHSVLAPGAAIKEPSSMFDSVPSDWFTTKKKQVFIDSAIKVMFVGSQILTQLVEDGNSMDDIREVLEKSDPLWESVNSKDSQGQTLLHLAISKTRPDLVQLILEFKPDIEATNSVGSTPLEAASSSGESLIVELLLAHKANTEGSESSVFRPIHHASREGHMEILRLLLLKGARVDSLTKDGNTSLHLAVEEKRRDCARLLLANGARTDVRNMREGDTPLHIAAANGDENMVKLLLHKGATKYVRNKLGKTAFDVAAENGHSRLFDALRLGDNLCAAARKGEVRTIQKVLESGGVINGRDQNGWTSLHRAAFKGRMDAVRFLVEKGIDLDAKDEDGYTALHCAAESGHADVTEFLVKKGADVEARTNKGVSALQIVESLNYVGITRILVNGGASREGLGEKPPSAPSKIPFGRKVESGSVMTMKKKMSSRTRALRGSFDHSMPLAVL